MDNTKFQNRLIAYDEDSKTILGMRALTQEQAGGGLKPSFRSGEMFHSTVAPQIPVRPDRHGYYEFREVLADYNSSSQTDGRTYLFVLRSVADVKAPTQLPSLKVGGRVIHVWGIVPDQHMDIHVLGKHWVIADDDNIIGGLSGATGDTYGSVERQVRILLEAIDLAKDS